MCWNGLNFGSWIRPIGHASVRSINRKEKKTKTSICNFTPVCWVKWKIYQFLWFYNLNICINKFNRWDRISFYIEEGVFLLLITFWHCEPWCKLYFSCWRYFNPLLHQRFTCLIFNGTLVYEQQLGRYHRFSYLKRVEFVNFSLILCWIKIILFILFLSNLSLPALWHRC